MNFELGGHIVQNAEPKKKEGKQPYKKKTSKLPQKQPAKKQSWHAADKIRYEDCEDG